MCMHSVHDHIAITMLPHSISMSFASQEDRCSGEQKDKPYTDYTGAFRCVISRGSLRAMHHHHHRWPTWLVPGLYLIGLHVLGLYVTCTWLGFDLYLALLLYLIGLHVLGLYVTCTWLGFGLYLACMYLTCMRFVLGLSLACTPDMLTCHLSLLSQFSFFLP